MFQITYHAPKNDGHMIQTLDVKDLGTHPSGWTIDGVISEDWYKWVDVFTATKGKWKVWGQASETVYATSQKAYDDFVANHPFREWDTWDI